MPVIENYMAHELARMAVFNNADWYRIMFDVHGLDCSLNDVSTNCGGLSNCFGQDALAAGATLCARLCNRKFPIVGYERGCRRTDAFADALVLPFCVIMNS